MADSFLHQLLGAVLAGVLSLAATVDTPEPAPRRPAERVPAGHPTGDPTGPAVGPAVGRDISWPNCPQGLGIPARRTLGKPLPPPGTAFVIIGLTNGPGFFPNPCLGEQVAYARSMRLPTAAYAVVTYPMREELRRHGAAGPRSSDTRMGRLFNTGWAQAAANVASMLGTGLTSPIVWVDVEPVRPPAPWSGDAAENRAVVEGTLAAYRRAGLRVGVYSTTYLWRSIVGEARYALPEWRAAGLQPRAAAMELCRRGEIQGGDPVLVQWATLEVDFDAVCPGRPARDVLREYFTVL